MGCFSSTPEPKVPVETEADRERKRYEAEAVRLAEIKRENERREREEKEIAIRVAAALEEKRIEAERLAAEREKAAKVAADLEKHREMKWKEELEAREKALAEKEKALSTPRGKKGARGRGASGGSNPSTPRGASPSNAGSPRPDASNGYGFNVTPTISVKTDTTSSGSGGQQQQQPQHNTGSQIHVTPYSPGSDGYDDEDMDDKHEYRPPLDHKQIEVLNKKEDPDLRSFRVTLTDSFVFWGLMKGKTPNLIANSDASQPPTKEAPGTHVGWTIEDGRYEITALPADGSGGPRDLPPLKQTWTGVDRTCRSQTVDLVRSGIPVASLELCPRIEIHSYFAATKATGENAVKFKVVVTLLDEQQLMIDQFVAKRTAKVEWTEIFHSFKRNHTYNRRPRYVIFKEYGRKKVVKGDVPLNATDVQSVRYNVLGSSVQLDIPT